MSISNLYGLILAGGKGVRFWPASRGNYPKHFLKIFDKKSFLEESFFRLKALVPPSHIFVVTTQNQVPLVKEHIRQIKNRNIIIEPLSRNTAAALALATLHLERLNNQPIIVTLPSDHKIGSPSDFISSIGRAISLAKNKKAIVTLGVKPAYPATGYGYIKAGAFGKVEKFIEKPSLSLAKKFIKNKLYFWNSGIFIFPASVMIEEIKKYRPRLYLSLLKIKSKTKAYEIYSRLEDISIDYAVMEKTKRLYMVEANFKWDDVGSWDSLGRHIRRDKNGNIISATHRGLDTKNCTLISPNGHLIATMGLKDMLIVQTKDATLVCPKNRLADIKALVKNLSRDKKLKRYI